MIRKIDELGRIGIPKTAREALKLSSDTPLAIDWSVEKGQITLKKIEPSCSICGGGKNLINRNQILLCQSCFEKICNGQ